MYNTGLSGDVLGSLCVIFSLHEMQVLLVLIRMRWLLSQGRSQGKVPGVPAPLCLCA